MLGLIVDGFAGGGGASQGIFQATKRHVDIAMNHDYDAIEMHKANHPNTLHYLNDIWKVDPLEATGGQTVDLAWFSPDCTHFSNARGGVPVEKCVRDLIWVTTKWIREVHPENVCIENVVELLSYGELMEKRDKDGQVMRNKDGRPLMIPDPARKGKLFEAWCASVRQEGYSLEWRELVAADYGAPTTRKRLVLVARRHNAAIVWPKPTHSRTGRGGLKKWLPASSIIDWSIEVPSIFDRKKPLVEKSVARIIKGLQRFVFTDPSPFLAPAQASAANHADLIVPWIMKRYGGMVGNRIDLPFPTVMVQGTQNVLACAKLKRAPADGYVTAAFLAEYYSEGGQHADLRAPFPTIPTKDRFGLVTVTIRGTDYVITDIGYRMLTPRELARAQGFPEDYVLTGNKHAQVARIGNSVCPAMAEAVVRALLASPQPKRKAA